MRKKLQTITVISVVVWGVFFSFTPFVHGQSASELEKRIEERKDIIKKLEEEAQKYQKEIEKTGQQKATLQSTIKVLDTTNKKLETDIKVTQTSISKTNLNISKLDFEIQEKNRKIEEGKLSIGKSLRVLSELDSQSILETLLSRKNISEVWNHAHALVTLNSKVRANIRELQGLTVALAEDKQETEVKKKELEQQKTQLSSQKKAVEYTKQEKTQVLKVTQNQEANYKKLLADKIAQKEAFEKELFEYEQKLKIVFDKSSYPTGKIGVLAWPLANIRITQYFGRTVDAARLYVSGSHNGVDFAASIGTPVKSALSGVVAATGNTDAQPGCYSYGKWVLVKHPNGLSSLYAHLSVISVTAGKEVATGDILGMSGNTGYSTGPHLHFGLFATAGMRVEKYASSNYCKNVTVPLADKSAYLDPMQYLPQ